MLRAITLPILGFLAFQAAFAQVAFKDPVELHIPSVGTDSMFGDVDGDGDNDVVFSTGGMLSVLYNDNTVFNRAETVLAEGTGVFTVHDFNSDGLLDIVVTTYDGLQIENISVFSFADHKFEKISSIQISEPNVFPTTIHCADLNKDGRVDVVLTFNLDGPFFLEFESTGESGVFNEKKISTPETISARSWMTDINNDGNQDLVFTTNSPEISIYKSNSEGAFIFDQILTSDKTVFDIAVADFNGDQKKDIVALSGIDPGVFEHYVQGSNGFFIKTSLPHQYETIFTVTAADVDNDNDIDISYDSKYSGFVLMINNGNGVFTEKPTNMPDDIGYDETFGDIDGDNFPEMLFSGYYRKIVILKKNGNEYKLASVFELPAKPADTGKMADLNNDGRLDLVLTYPGVNTVSVAYNSGEQKWFDRPWFFKLRIKPRITRTCRINNDNLADVLFTTIVPDNNGPYGYMSHLDGLVSDENGQLRVVEDLDADGHFNVENLDPGDFNNDGVDDIHTWFFTLFKDEAGKYDWVQAPSVASSITSQVVADFNDDGFDDVAISTGYSSISGDNGIAIRWGQDQKMLSTGPFTDTEVSYFLNVANLNGDEFPDLVGYDHYGVIVLMVGNGDGTFVFSQTNIDIINWYNDGKSYAIFDVDRDGDDDLGVITFNETMDIYINDGTGAMMKTAAIAVPDPLPYTVLSGNINDDDLPDLILLPEDGPSRILINDMVTEPTVVSSVTVSERTSSSAKLSFEGGNGDGRLLLMRQSSATNAEPADNTLYVANSEMTKGSKLEFFNYVTFFGAENSVVVTGLKPGTTYYYTLFESNRNESGTLIDYLTSTSTSGSFTTKISQEIEFLVSDKNEGDPDFDLEATSESETPIVYSVLYGNVTLNDKTVTINGPGPVTVVATQEGNEDIDEGYAEVTFCVDPAKPVISLVLQGTTFSSSSTTNNQWYLEASPIEGANQQTYKATEDGTYIVRVDYEGCWTESDPYNIVTGIEDIAAKIEISPNPATKKLLIKTGISERSAIQPVVLDMTGRTYTLQSSIRPDGIELDVEKLSAGFYVLRVGNGMSFKFVKE